MPPDPVPELVDDRVFITSLPRQLKEADKVGRCNLRKRQTAVCRRIVAVRPEDVERQSIAIKPPDFGNFQGRVNAKAIERTVRDIHFDR
jgi:hypothetical protein